jgi:hypothetical protein
MVYKPRRSRVKAGVRDDVPQRQELQHVEINGHGFVSNLFWQPLNNARSYMSEAKTFGKQNGWDIVAIRRGTRIQAGFVDSGSRNLKGMYSLAASLASQLGDSWLGAFKLNDGRYAVVGVHEMLICPGLDRLCSAEEAKALLTNANNTYSFDSESIFAPPELEFSSNSRDIYQVLAAKTLRKDNKLKQLTFGMSTRQLAIVAVGVLTLAGAGVGYLQWEGHKEALRQAQIEAARALEQKRLAEVNASARHQLEQASLAHPWAVQPNAGDFVAGCGKVTDALPLSVAGWTFDSAVCNGSGVRVTYARKPGGTTDGMRAAAHGAFGTTVTFTSGDSAAINLWLRVPVGGDDAIVGQDDEMSAFLTHFQRMGLQPNVEERPVKIDPPKVPAGQPPIEAPVATWRQFHFSFEDVSQPANHFAAAKEGAGSLSKIPGLRVDSVTTTLNPDDATPLTWHIEGNIYAKK